jgi:hypothetical protein
MWSLEKYNFYTNCMVVLVGTSVNGGAMTGTSCIFSGNTADIIRQPGLAVPNVH